MGEKNKSKLVKAEDGQGGERMMGYVCELRVDMSVVSACFGVSVTR